MLIKCVKNNCYIIALASLSKGAYQTFYCISRMQTKICFMKRLICSSKQADSIVIEMI